MKRKQLKVLGLSYSQSQVGSYIVVLSEKKGNRKLPIIIKPMEAQQIAVKMEEIKPSRPLTHDLFKSLSDAFNIDIQEVYIHTLAEGIFYAKITASNGSEETEIECTVGDAIAISLTNKCPIWVTQEIIKSAGIEMNDDGSSISGIVEEETDDDGVYEEPTKKTSVEDLEHLMENAISNEEYEIAASIRDRIKKMKEGQI
jgi:bifunctional DNase/RNase